MTEKVLPLYRIGKFIVLFISSCGFLSILPFLVARRVAMFFPAFKLSDKWTGAGLVGSLAGALTYSLLRPGWMLALVVSCGGILVAVWVSDRAEKYYQLHDDSRIVIDEWIGCFIALIGTSPDRPGQLLTGFILFRFFDVIKGPWGQAIQRWPGGWGIVMDDVAAGILANLLNRLLSITGAIFL